MGPVVEKIKAFAIERKHKPWGQEASPLGPADHFTCARLLRYTFPSIVMMILASVYGVVDGLFLSNYVGKTAFSAVNFILPFLLILGGVGFMFGTGGSALVAKTLGEGKRFRGHRIFSSLVYASGLTGLVLAFLGSLLIRPVATWLGAEGPLLEESLRYGRIYLLGVPASVLQYEFQNLYVTANRPKLGLLSTSFSGMANLVLDALFIVLFGWGLVGAAAATALSQWLGALLPLAYFSRRNGSLLRLVPAPIDLPSIGRICLNGSSELLNNLSMSTVSMIYNWQLLRYAGADGLAAYGVLMYVCFLFLSIFIGYTVGVSPVISFHYGAGHPMEIRGLLVRSYAILGALSLLMFLLAEICAAPIARGFVGYDASLRALTERGFLLFSFSFLLSGFAIFGSSFFTALNNGPVSALISCLRTLVFEIALVLSLPPLLGTDGIWLATVGAELSAAFLGVFFILAKRKAYGY